MKEQILTLKDKQVLEEYADGIKEEIPYGIKKGLLAFTIAFIAFCILYIIPQNNITVRFFHFTYAGMTGGIGWAVAWGVSFKMKQIQLQKDVTNGIKLVGKSKIRSISISKNIYRLESGFNLESIYMTKQCEPKEDDAIEYHLMPLSNYYLKCEVVD